jgi:hypothetical protein
MRSLNAALEASGEKFWRLPLGEEYAELIKSDIGDIKNTGGRWGGAITAAEFLKVFVEETPWIHLDIAGMAWVEDSRPYIANADPSTHHPQTEERLGPLSLRMTVVGLDAETFAAADFDVRAGLGLRRRHRSLTRPRSAA